MPDAVDTTFDVYSDTPSGKDPDSHSPTLRGFHKVLWSKPLPNGQEFNLSISSPGLYLHHKSSQGEFELSSDAIGHTYRHVKAMAQTISETPKHDVETFFSKCSTIGAYTIFPSKKVNRKPTINGMRGLSWHVKDRFDLTLECIRRHYARETSPLAETLVRYGDFFQLFESFEGYVEFFLFQDLISPDGSVQFFLPFDDFESSPLPSSVERYRNYREALLTFVEARNSRIDDLSSP
ncbi:MAG: hypothetical protein QNJ13_03120 [Paracoccaceae bacterium]|nr:hypothetical protein [Paracoccaceae bacterium]